MDQLGDRLGEGEGMRQRRISQLVRRYTSHDQRVRRRQDMGCEPAAEVDALDPVEVVVRPDRRELKRLIEGRRGAGGFQVVEHEGHGPAYRERYGRATGLSARSPQLAMIISRTPGSVCSGAWSVPRS